MPTTFYTELHLHLRNQGIDNFNIIGAPPSPESALGKFSSFTLTFLSLP
jgi:hypothetical protein